MITEEDLKKELLRYEKMDTLEPLFNVLVAADKWGHTQVYNYEQLRKEYNHLIDVIEHYLNEIRRLDNQLEACMETIDELIDKLHG